MARKSKRSSKLTFSLTKLLKSRRSMSSLIVVVLMLIGLVNPQVRDQAAETLDLLIPGFTNPFKPLPSKSKSPLTEGIWTVVHVTDGDTLDVADSTGNEHRIRLIGADTPETVKPNTPVQPFGPEASDFTKQKIVEANNSVRIAFDGEQVDRYGRSLAMVYLQMPTGQEVWLNELLIREGLAHAQLQYRFSKGAQETFRQAENEAKAARKNLWSIP